MSYPNDIDTFPARTADDLIPVEDYDNQNDSIIAIETELGTLPKGGSASVKARLDTNDTAVSGKLDKTGGLMTGDLEMDYSVSSNRKIFSSDGFGVQFDDFVGRVDLASQPNIDLRNNQAWGTLRYDTNSVLQWKTNEVRSQVKITTTGASNIESNADVVAGGKVNAVTGFQANGVDGASGSFTTVDAKTVTVVNGIITSIV